MYIQNAFSICEFLKFNIVDTDGGCGGIYNNILFGKIYFPKSGDYANSLDCSWYYNAPTSYWPV